VAGATTASGGTGGATSMVQAPRDLKVPPLAFDETSVTVIWSKPEVYSNISSYQIYRDGVLVGSTAKLFFTVTDLAASTAYTFTARAVAADGAASADSNAVVQVTAATPTVLDVTTAPYQAVGNGTTLDTAAIQRAIDACPAGGKVVLPSGRTFLSGALNLKSNCTFQLDGTLLGSSSASDYPYTSQRFPYYPVTNYMGLLNAYTTTYGSLTNIRVTGSGTITGSAGSYDVNGYTVLGNAEIRNGDNTTRGDMITIKGVDGLYFGGVTLRNPAEHTIFLSYSQNVTVAGITVNTFDIANADGVDIAVSDTVYVFDSTFDTGDDCINLNAGSSAPGVAEGIPASNVRIFNNVTRRGHGAVAFGSFTAGWIENILVEDCLFDGTNIGLRFKTGADRGGGARNVLARDITMTNILNQAISVDSHYTAGTQFPPATTPGVFQNITIENVVASLAATSCNATTGSSTNAGIWLYGLANAPETGVSLSNVAVSNGGTGQNCAGASIDWVTNSTFDLVTLQGFNTAWDIVTADTSGLTFRNCSPAVP
jgi:exo-poly-alpha-galacturonosidase